MLGQKLGCVVSKTKSLSQILENPCVHSRGHNFDQKFMQLYQNVKSRIISKLSSVWFKTRSLGHISEKNLCTQKRAKF